jgi:peptide/nickel transport system permease protein
VTRFILRRIVTAILVLAVASVAVFTLVTLAPGDPAQIVAERRSFGADREMVERVRAELGLDRPLPVRYLDWLGGVVRGDLGTSLRTNGEIWAELRERTPTTALLVFGATLFALIVGAGAGILGALFPSGLHDRLSRLTALAAVSIPGFYLGALLVLLFAVTLQWLPAEGVSGPSSWLLPCVTLGLASGAVLSRVVRVGLAEALSSRYVTTALSRGSGRRGIVLRDALPNVAVPTLTALATQIGVIITGAIVIEAVFSWQGAAIYFLEAVKFRDFPVLQAWLLLFAALFVTINTVVDIATRAIDPRLRRAVAEGMT